MRFGRLMIAGVIAYLAQATAAAQPPAILNQASASAENASNPIAWGRVDYLRWWVSRGPIVPLITTGDPNDPVPGALGQPGTRVLFGDSSVDFGGQSGLRVALGSWLSDEQIFGWEVSGFALERRSRGYSAASDLLGNPPLFVPRLVQEPGSPNFGGEGTMIIANPDPANLFVGTIAAGSSTRLWGVEGNGLFLLTADSGWTFDAIVGVRYLSLDEKIALSGLSNNVNFDEIMTFSERFATRNRFVGAQAGARAQYRLGALTLEALGKLALGVMEQELDVYGASTFTGTGAVNPGTFPGAIFTQPSNIGDQSSHRFGFIPHGQVNVAWQARSWLVFNMGYDVVWMNSVVRPGDQMDRNINATQVNGGALVGAALPAQRFDTSSFWAHGLTVGIELRY